MYLGRTQLAVASLDVDKASGPMAVEWAMVYNETPAWANVAVLWELMATAPWPTDGEVATQYPVALGKGARRGVGTPTLWNLIASAFAAPLVETWDNEPRIAWCDAFAALPIFWFADNSYVIADTPDKLKTRCRSLVEAASDYQIPFSNGSLETLQNGGEMSHMPTIAPLRTVHRSKSRLSGWAQKGRRSPTVSPDNKRRWGVLQAPPPELPAHLRTQWPRASAGVVRGRASASRA